MRWALAGALLLFLLACVPAAAQSVSLSTPKATTTTAPNTPVPVIDLDAALPGRKLTAGGALAIAKRDAKVTAELRRFENPYSGVYTKGPRRWQVSWFSREKPPVEIAQLYVDDATGAVTESWTGPQVAWTMARGYEGAFGRKVNSPWIWIPLTLAFLAPFVLVRGVRLDLFVLAAFGISVAFFNDGNLDASVPLVYPGLAYVLGRMLWIGLKRDETPRAPMRLWIPIGVLGVMVVFLLGFRTGLNLTNSNVIDVGYAGVIGADKLLSGEPLYGAFPKDNEHGDTYGPVTYAAYVPFKLVFGWTGEWDDLPAAHGAAVVFDLLCVLTLFLLGRRVRGPALGVVLAYLWAAFPFTLYASATNTNDALVALFMVLALLAATSAPARGAAVALGGLTKFATLAVAPLFAMHGFHRTRTRGLFVFSGVFAAVALLALAPVFAQGESLTTVYDRTLGFQASRGSPFSVWGLHDLVGPQHVWQVGSVGLAVALALVPRRRDVVGLAACAAATVVALQAGVTHWFYLYIVWFFPLVMVALFARYSEDDPLGAPVPSQAISSG